MAIDGSIELRNLLIGLLEVHSSRLLEAMIVLVLLLYRLLVLRLTWPRWDNDLDIWHGPRLRIHLEVLSILLLSLRILGRLLLVVGVLVEWFIEPIAVSIAIAGPLIVEAVHSCNAAVDALD